MTDNIKNIKNTIITVIMIIAGIFSLFIICRNSMKNSSSRFTPSNETPEVSETDKSRTIASFIQENVNIGGYTGCEARSIGNQVVQVDMHFPAGTSRLTVEVNTQGVADRFAQVGRLASTIYYAGYSGAQKVCEYKYDMMSGMVDKIK